MILQLKRRRFSETATIGELYVDGQRECYTLEDVVRDGPKVPGATAVPAGTYEVVVTYSNRFQKRMPLLLKVPGFTGIRIHCGNTDKDTEGCILVGSASGPDMILQSRAAFDKLFPKIADAVEHDAVHIVITNEPTEAIYDSRLSNFDLKAGRPNGLSYPLQNKERNQKS